ncbi:MAG TPA: nuclear transport factor 2 family protein [Solirubrobacteraceae bacterium]|jgi:ketosteroid isomerase-like protein|nr:nuclear transport factor 2 family protein [Solirubrobacteraceae bacterium]
MSRANVEVARRAMDALNHSDLMVGGGDPLPTLRKFCDPDVEWDFARRAVDPEIYHGYQGWLRIAEQFGDAWQELRLEIVEIIDAGDNVVLFTDMVGLSKSGIKLSQRVGQVWTFRDGKIVRDQYFGEDRVACLEAVGLAG